MTELQAYKELIQKKAEESSQETLPNAGKEHAAIVMTEMFKHTEKNVNMLVGSFDGNISNDKEYLTELEKAIDKGISINVIFLEQPNKTSHTYQLLSNKKNEGRLINFKIANQDNLPKFHFSVFDENKYRFEKDIEKYLAWVCFNDSEGAKKLNKLFALYSESATPI